jgi:heme exporter protein A
MFTLNQLCCERDGRDLFAPLTLGVAAGDYVELLGANGSGKSTLLRTLAGLHSQFSGSYETVPAVYQGHRLGLDDLLTPVENLLWFAGLEGATLSLDRILDALQETGILTKAYDNCAAMSAGQQRRVAMARWMLSQRKLWLLDEPLTALDIEAQAVASRIIKEHCASGGAVICATHQPLDLTDKTTLTLTPQLAETAS